MIPHNVNGALLVISNKALRAKTEVSQRRRNSASVLQHWNPAWVFLALDLSWQVHNILSCMNFQLSGLSYRFCTVSLLNCASQVLWGSQPHYFFFFFMDICIFIFYYFFHFFFLFVVNFVIHWNETAMGLHMIPIPIPPPPPSPPAPPRFSQCTRSKRLSHASVGG